MYVYHIHLSEWLLVAESEVYGLEVDDVKVAGHLGVRAEGTAVLPDQLYRPEWKQNN